MNNDRLNKVASLAMQSGGKFFTLGERYKLEPTLVPTHKGSQEPSVCKRPFSTSIYHRVA